MRKIREKLYRHRYQIAILLLSMMFFSSILSSSKILSNIHFINDVTFYSYNVKKSISEMSLPLWTPFYYSGRPLYAQPEYHFLDMNFILILLTGNIYFAMNYSMIFYFALAGLGMFLLARYFTENDKASFIASFVYMFNAFVHTFVIGGNIMVMEGYSLVPLIFLFFLKALKEKDFILNSVICAIFTVFLIYAGGVIFMPFIAVLFVSYSAIYLIGDNLKGKIVKLLLCLAIIAVAAFSLSAIKLLPGLEFMKLSNRGDGVPYHEYLGEPIKPKNIAYAIITNVFLSGEHISSAIGLAASILVVFALKNTRNKNVIFLLIVSILSLLMATESFLSQFLFKVPVFSQTRHIERAIYLFAFSASALCAFGYISLRNYTSKINERLVFCIIIALIGGELILMNGLPKSEKVTMPEDIPILANMSMDTSIFRTMNIALNDVIGATGYNYYSQMGIGEIKGGGGIWFNDYIEYLIVAEDAKAKFWGNLNNKYVIAKSRIDSEDFEFAGEFGQCTGCSVVEAYGPYLFVNKQYMPRYYSTDSVVLISGIEDDARKIAYGIMLSNLWSPKKATIISGKKAGAYTPDILKSFKAIVIVSNPDNTDLQLLRQYRDNGGTLIPDIFEGRNGISEEDLRKIFEKDANIVDINVAKNQNNMIEIENKIGGWVVASERFSHFPGWVAKSGNELGLHKANAVISAVYSKPGNITFEYAPKEYKLGKILTFVSMIVLAVYIFYVYKKRGDKHKAGH